MRMITLLLVTLLYGCSTPDINEVTPYDDYERLTVDIEETYSLSVPLSDNLSITGGTELDSIDYTIIIEYSNFNW